MGVTHDTYHKLSITHSARRTELNISKRERAAKGEDTTAIADEIAALKLELAAVNGGADAKAGSKKKIPVKTPKVVRGEDRMSLCVWINYFCLL